MNLKLFNIIDKILIYTKTRNIFRYIYLKYCDYLNSKILKNNINLYNVHKNKKCFIITGGRSLNEIDFTRIKNEYSISCNFINYHPNFIELNLDYYICIPSHYTLYNSHLKSEICNYEIPLNGN